MFQIVRLMSQTTWPGKFPEHDICEKSTDSISEEVPPFGSTSRINQQL